MNLTRRAVSELIGTAMLLASVVGSGIMGERRDAAIVRRADGNSTFSMARYFVNK